MFDYIKGKITYVYAKYIVVENNGLGYIIHVSNPYEFELNSDTIVFTYNYIREEINDLYGFKQVSERELFIKLISVKGIGPKGALAILASGDIDGLKEAINKGDSKYLQRYPGIGPKASGQIILDLRGKLDNSVTTNPKIDNVKEALKSLGYSNVELKKLDKFLSENINLPIEELIKLSLKKML